MTNEEIKEGNILIDQFFTGRELTPTGNCMGRKRGSPRYENWYNMTTIGDLDYNTCWNSLMPVVECIENLKPNGLSVVYGIQIDSNYCVIRKDGEITIAEHQSDTKIDSTFRAVIEFITWYNSQSNIAEK